MTKTCFGNIIIFVTSFNKFVINEKEKVMIGDYMTNRILKTAGLFCFCTLMAAAAPERAMADQEAPRPLLHAVDGPEEPEIIIAGRKDTEDQAGASMLIQVEDENTEVYSEPDTESQVVGQAEAGDTYDVLEMVNGQWAKISTGEFEGYLNTAAAEDEEETLEDAPEEAPVVPVETAEETAARVSAERRQAVVEYGLQFVGNRYVYGGTNPNKEQTAPDSPLMYCAIQPVWSFPTPPDPRLSRAVRSAQQRSVRAIWYSMPAESASTMWPCISATARWYMPPTRGQASAFPNGPTGIRRRSSTSSVINENFPALRADG